MRCFIALPLPDDSKAALTRLQHALPGGHPVPEDNLHLTLVFIADLPDAMMSEVDLAISTIRSAPIDLRFQGWAHLPSSEQGLLAVAVEGGAALTELQAGLERRLRRAGLNLPRRRYQPHVTLARPDRRMPLDEARLGRFLMGYPATGIPSGRATDITLYRSELSPRGPTYTALARYPILSPF